MKVYLLVHESYSHWNGDYYVDVKSFKNKQSAINYLTIWKNEILNDYLGEETENIKTIEEYKESLGGSLYCLITTEDDWFKVDVKDAGYDILYIEEQDVMEFEL